MTTYQRYFREGWGMSYAASKAHYFRRETTYQLRSLCGHVRRVFSLREPDGEECKRCRGMLP